jgi:hypothetical protein
MPFEPAGSAGRLPTWTVPRDSTDPTEISPETPTLPATSSFLLGLSTPMPTLPLSLQSRVLRLPPPVVTIWV